LENLLFDFFDVPTRVDYGEKGRKSALQQRAMLGAATLLRGLRSLQHNLAFSPIFLKQALDAVAARRGSEWRFSEEDHETWSIAVGVRVRTMCRHFRQALLRKTVPAWARKVAGDGVASKAARQQSLRVLQDDDDGKQGARLQEEEEDEAAGRVRNELAPESADFYVGFDAETNLAWRVRSDDEANKREYTRDVGFPPEAKDTDTCCAKWPDGYTHELATVAVARWKAHAQASAPKRAPPLWELSGYYIRARADRKTRRGPGRRRSASRAGWPRLRPQFGRPWTPCLSIPSSC